MNEAVQSLGYGLAALLFCAVICAICQMIKKLAYWFYTMRSHSLITVIKNCFDVNIAQRQTESPFLFGG